MKVTSNAEQVNNKSSIPEIERDSPRAKIKEVAWHLFQGYYAASIAICAFVPQARKTWFSRTLSLATAGIPIATIWSLFQCLKLHNPLPTQAQRVYQTAVTTLSLMACYATVAEMVPLSSTTVLVMAIATAIWTEMRATRAGTHRGLGWKFVLAHATVFPLIDFLATIAIDTIITKTRPVCLSPHLLNSIITPLEKYGDVKELLLYSVLKRMGFQAVSPMVEFVGKTIVTPILEEFVDRQIVQEYLLRRLPRFILNKMAPSKAWIIESRPVKVTRIVLASALFALTHLNSLKCSQGGGVFQFTEGLFLGIQTERHGHILGSTLQHMAYNSMLYIRESVT